MPRGLRSPTPVTALNLGQHSVVCRQSRRLAYRIEKGAGKIHSASQGKQPLIEPQAHTQHHLSPIPSVLEDLPFQKSGILQQLFESVFRETEEIMGLFMEGPKKR